MRRNPFPPAPNDVSPQLRAYLNAVRDYVEMMAGGLSESRRRSVTFEDLVSMGIITSAEAEDRSKVRS